MEYIYYCHILKYPFSVEYHSIYFFIKPILKYVVSTPSSIRNDEKNALKLGY